MPLIPAAPCDIVQVYGNVRLIENRFWQYKQHRKAAAPDGMACLVAHGSDLKFYPAKNFAHLSWIAGDQVHLIRRP